LSCGYEFDGVRPTVRTAGSTAADERIAGWRQGRRTAADARRGAIGGEDQYRRLREGWLRSHGMGGYTPRTPLPAGVQELGRLDFFQGHSRNRVAVVVTSDGRRVTVPLRDLESQDVSLLGLIRSLLAGLDSLLGLLITGSRRENGGTRRNERH
jgi:hypothetical protein